MSEKGKGQKDVAHSHTRGDLRALWKRSFDMTYRANGYVTNAHHSISSQRFEPSRSLSLPLIQYISHLTHISFLYSFSCISFSHAFRCASTRRSTDRAPYGHGWEVTSDSLELGNLIFPFFPSISQPPFPIISTRLSIAITNR